MTKLLHRVHETFPGRILKVDLDQGEGTDENSGTYEVKVLTSGGNVLKLFYDARTLRLERILGRYRSGNEGGGDMVNDGSRSSGSGGAGSDDGPSHDSGDDHGGSDSGSSDSSSDD